MPRVEWRTGMGDAVLDVDTMNDACRTANCVFCVLLIYKLGQPGSKVYNASWWAVFSPQFAGHGCHILLLLWAHCTRVGSAVRIPQMTQPRFPRGLVKGSDSQTTQCSQTGDPSCATGDCIGPSWLCMYRTAGAASATTARAAPASACVTQPA